MGLLELRLPGAWGRLLLWPSGRDAYYNHAVPSSSSRSWDSSRSNMAGGDAIFSIGPRVMVSRGVLSVCVCVCACVCDNEVNVCVRVPWLPPRSGTLQSMESLEGGNGT